MTRRVIVHEFLPMVLCLYAVFCLSAELQCMMRIALHCVLSVYTIASRSCQETRYHDPVGNNVTAGHAEAKDMSGLVLI